MRKEERGGILGMKIPASKLKAWETLFENSKGIRYTLIVFADTKARAIKVAERRKHHPKDKMIFIRRSYEDKLGGYYKGKSIDVEDL